MIQELKLVNRLESDADETNETPFKGFSDIEYDENGHFLRCTGEEGLEQNILKSAITEVQPNGYGTSVSTLLGKKNLDFIRGKLMTEILSSYNTLKKNQLNFLSQHNTYDKKNIISKVLNIKIDKGEKTTLDVSLKIYSLENQLKNSNNLQEVITKIG